MSVLFYAIVYFPPKSSNESELIDHFLESCDYIRTNFPDAGITIIGDLNRLDDSQICAGNGLVQVVDKPTRKDAILDKIITNMQICLGITMSQKYRVRLEPATTIPFSGRRSPLLLLTQMNIVNALCDQ